MSSSTKKPRKKPLQLNDPPVPFDENNDPEKFWLPDPGDDYLPKGKGLISDVVYHLRGFEVPTLFAVWATLFAVSTMVKREVWIPWGNRKLYSNYYTILVGPAGVAMKGTVIDVAIDMLANVSKFIEDGQLRKMKRIHTLRDKATPEAILEAMDPRKRTNHFKFTDEAGNFILDNKGRPIIYRNTSEIGIIVPEMATMLGKQRYNDGLIEILLGIYDNHTTWEWSTVGRGLVTLRNLHTTLIAGTTPGGFKSSIPQAALGDGFLSRCAIVYQGASGRRFPIPRIPRGAPSIEELSARLAWIGTNSMGAFELSPEAFDAYTKWYFNFKDVLEQDSVFQGVRSRQAVILLKVALLIRLQRYDATDNLISLQDFEDAERLVAKTFYDSVPLVRDLTGGFDSNMVSRAEEYIMRHKKVTRRHVMQRGHIPTSELSIAVEQLAQEGRIKITLNGEQKFFSTKDGSEVYEWIDGIEEEIDPSPTSSVQTE